MTTAPTPIRLDDGDVSVVPFENRCDDCADDIPRGVTHYVLLDMRNTGTGHEVYRGCEKCCLRFASKLCESLPKGRGGR